MKGVKEAEIVDGGLPMGPAKGTALAEPAKATALRASLDPEIDVDRYFLMGRPSKATTSDKTSSANVSATIAANENAAAERASGGR